MLDVVHLLYAQGRTRGSSTLLFLHGAALVYFEKYYVLTGGECPWFIKAMTTTQARSAAGMQLLLTSQEVRLLLFLDSVR